MAYATWDQNKLEWSHWKRQLNLRRLEVLASHGEGSYSVCLIHTLDDCVHHSQNLLLKLLTGLQIILQMSLKIMIMNCQDMPWRIPMNRQELPWSCHKVSIYEFILLQVMWEDQKFWCPPHMFISAEGECVMSNVSCCRTGFDSDGWMCMRLETRNDCCP